jgi:hypothetical protein
MYKKILDFLLYPITKYREHRAWKKRLAELKKRDPFIYK